ncbi:LacI family DNA-binding transcriptional regulator [Phytoactinopolyspora alkaliphila]|uniref:LacI family DNA-binding transcriptional regulator n=1 Tax=Phytoactinopolyspora alkaliphila TaxID=1783498 RepID=A0A6N9YRB6_9ACTN|nr:LacI family DNA-binding transcriptional regulator [Phytoactinopolyspora alkaliphila]
MKDVARLAGVSRSLVSLLLPAHDGPPMPS